VGGRADEPANRPSFPNRTERNTLFVTLIIDQNVLHIMATYFCSFYNTYKSIKFYFFSCCVFLRIWKPVNFCRGKGRLENCFWDAICNRVSAKYVGTIVNTMKCRFPHFFSSVGSGLNSVGFGWFPLGLAGTGEP
jgi:hypothetical protein